jgi:hypothetical protein
MSKAVIRDNETSELYRRWHRQVVEPPQNDFVILVSASSSTPVSGTGKTTLLTQLARKFDRSPGGFDATEQATLDVGTLAYDLAPELPPGSALVGDEIQGTPGAEGFDARRGMKQEVIDGISAILANRNDGYTIILAAQQIGSLDKRLIPLIDAWILIREEPPEPVATVHSIHDNDFNLSSVDPRTPRLETISWEPVPGRDSDYAALEEMKEQAKTRGGSGDDDTGTDGLPKPAQIELAQALRDTGKTLREIAKNDKITYSRTWLGEHTTADSEEENTETATA